MPKITFCHFSQTKDENERQRQRGRERKRAGEGARCTRRIRNILLADFKSRSLSKIMAALGPEADTACQSSNRRAVEP